MTRRTFSFKPERDSAAITPRAVARAGSDRLGGAATPNQ